MTVSTLLNTKEALARSAAWLAEKGVPAARLDAELLLAQVLGVSRLDLYLAWDRPLEEGEKGRYRELLKRRASFEPVAYIVGRKEFLSLELRVTPDVLVPRPETEILAELVIERCRQDDTGASGVLRLADVGTGSGALAVALAVNLEDARVVATDMSPQALAVASENARAHGVHDRVDFRNVSLLDGIDGPFDWVVANLPYVAERDRDRLSPDVLNYEPHEALFAGQDGLDAIAALVAPGAEALEPGGWLALEVGAGQASAVRDLIAETGAFDPAEARNDYQGVERVVAARKRAEQPEESGEKQ